MNAFFVFTALLWAREATIAYGAFVFPRVLMTVAHQMMLQVLTRTVLFFTTLDLNLFI